MSPFYGMRPLSSGNVEKFAVLLGRHIQVRSGWQGLGRGQLCVLSEAR